MDKFDPTPSPKWNYNPTWSEGTSNKEDADKKLAFLKSYKELCLEHGFEIKGCGECGSAYLEELTEQRVKNSTLIWRDDSDSGDFECIQFAYDDDLEGDEVEERKPWDKDKML